VAIKTSSCSSCLGFVPAQVQLTPAASTALRLALSYAGYGQQAVQRIVSEQSAFRPVALVEETIGEMDILTRLTPAIRVVTSGPEADKPSAVGAILKPALHVRSPFGEFRVAPYGDPGTSGGLRFGLVVAAVAAVGGLITAKLLQKGR